MSRSNEMLNIAERTAQPGLIRGPVNLAYAFVERQTNLWKRYWAWERWEGTSEHTLMAPVSRAVHLIGMSIFGVLHAIVRTLLIFAIAVPFFSVDLGQANWFAAAVVIVVGSVSVAGLGILTGVLPL